MTATTDGCTADRLDGEIQLVQAAASALVLEASITLEVQPYSGLVLAIAVRS